MKHHLQLHHCSIYSRLKKRRSRTAYRKLSFNQVETAFVRQRDRETRRESLITAAAELTEDRHRHGACQALVSQSIHTWQLLQQLDSSFPALCSSHHAPPHTFLYSDWSKGVD